MQEAGGCPQGASGMGVRGGRRGAPEADRAGEIVLQVPYLTRRWERTPLHGGIKRCRYS